MSYAELPFSVRDTIERSAIFVIGVVVGVVGVLVWGAL